MKCYKCVVRKGDEFKILKPMKRKGFDVYNKTELRRAVRKELI